MFDMKTSKCFLASFILMSGILTTAYSQNPTYTLDVNDLYITSIPEYCCDSLEFDIDMTWTNSGIAPNFEYAGGQYFFDFNKDCIKSGTTWEMTIADADLPVSMRPRNPTVYTVTTPGQLRFAVNTFPGVGNGFLMPANIPLTIARVRIKATGGDQFFAPALLQLAWRSALPNPFTKIFCYVGTTGTDITTPASHSISIPNDPMGAMIAAYFSASPTTISAGQSVSFTDQTFGSSPPVAWAWSFPSGTPSTSTDRNPVITYNTPGVYNVSLISSSSQYSNLTTRYSYITVQSGCIATWKQTLKVRDAGTSNDSLKFGMSPAGTNGIDSCLGEITVPPPPPTGVFDCRFVLATNDAVKNDFRKDTAGSVIWRMTFQPSVSGYPITFNWNIASFPATGGFFLKDEITGTLVNVNMRSQSSYTLTTSGITSLKIEYNNVTMSSSVTSGWNIVSVPVRTSDMLFSTLFPGVASPAYAYSSGYVSISMLSNGTGYWMKFNNASNFNFTGYPWTPENMLVSPGWNLIGPFDNNIPISSIMSNPAGIVTSNYFGYNGGYYNPDTLKVGRGYWIRTSTAGYLYQGSADNNPNVIATNPLEDFVEVRFTNGDENSTALYLGNASELTSDYSMPPVPPSGIFDVRFATDKFVEELGKIHSLKLNSASGQTRITLHNARGLKMKIKDAIDGTIINKEIEEGTEIIIPANLENLVLETNGIIPKTYELSQNYPNPFNPVTTIKYQIPDDGLVKLIVFDVLGREVKTLVNTVQTAGVYEVRFDASDVASGVYFYKLLAGKFEDLKKMIILK
jgi:PKD repeat protein